MKGLRIAVAILAAAAAVTAQSNMYGSSQSSWSSSGGGTSSSSSSSSTSSGGGSVSNSVINQSQPGGSVNMGCGGVGVDMVWYREDGGGRRELARNGRLISAPPHYRLDSSNTLTINPTKVSDTGLFICETRPSSGLTTTHTYKLTIGGSGNGGASRTAGASAGFMGALMLLM